MSRPASVQRTRISLEAIEDDVVCLGGGEYRAVLEITGASSALDDEARQEAALAGYAAFLNGLSFPVQVLVRAAPVELGRYLAAIEERARHELPGELGALAREHAAFVQGLARRRTLLERRFYVVVPAQSAATSSGVLPWRRGRGADGPVEAQAAHRQLSFRCEEVARQLVRCGLAARRLGDLELAQLFLACWSPERARSQRFRQRLDDYTTLAVRAISEPTRGAHNEG
jgi:hypothetical protein